MRSNELQTIYLADRTWWSKGLTLSSWLDRIKSRIEELIKLQAEPILINVAGWSASWKTSKITEEIIKIHEGNIIKISMDDYYRWKTFMQEEEQKWNNLNWDQPEALNISLMKEHLQSLKEGKAINKPTYCMKTSEPIWAESIEPSKLILLEWLFTLSQELAEESGLKIFVESDTTTRLTRRILRDMTRTGQRAEDIISYFHKIVEPMHQKYIEPTKMNADIVIQNNLSEQEIG
jgi:uridine kinase